MRRAKDDLDGLQDIFRSHLEDLWQTQREIRLDACFERESPDEIAGRRGISVNTYDIHRKTASSKQRESLMAVIDLSTNFDLPDWYDGVEEMKKCDAARSRRRAARKQVNRSKFEGDGSNFEGDRSKSRGDANKNARARDSSVVVTTKS